MKHLIYAVILTCALAVTAPLQAFDATFYLVRHAEKVKSETDKDPSLTDIGVARAGQFAKILKDVKLTKIFSTNTKRTRMTASLVAAQAGLPISPCENCSKEGMAAFGKKLLMLEGNYLIVGHSNTIPALAAALTGKPHDDLEDNQYDRVYIVTLGADGKTHLTMQHSEPRTP